MDETVATLVVDDEEAFRNVLSRQLSRMGCACATAAGGAEAIGVMREGAFDVAFLDLTMPDMSGLELLGRMAEEGFETTPVVITGGGSIESAVEAMRRGAFDYIEKGADAETLRDVVKRASDQCRLKRRAREMAEAANTLKGAYQETERLVASMSSFLVGVGADFRVFRWNTAAEKVFGKTADDVLTKPFSECGIAWDWDKIAASLDHWLATDEPIRLDDIRYTRQDGVEGILSMVVNPLKTDDGAPLGFFLTGQDITERRNLEDQLAQAQKLESIGQLAAGIAHEINTPTQYVGDNVRFLQDAFNDLAKLHRQVEKLVQKLDGDGDANGTFKEIKETIDEIDLDYLKEEIPQAIEQSLEGVSRVARIVRAMKEFSHPNVQEKTATDLNHAIESTVTVARNEWKYVAELETDFDPDLPPVSCLPGEFNQVILNIIVNAAHAIGDAVGENSEEKGRICVQTRRDGEWAEIRISDTGPGIPEAIRSRVFDPFFTTKETGKGTGQGLAIAHNVVVEKHGGTLTLETETGKGTTFIIRLPVNASEGDEGDA